MLLVPAPLSAEILYLYDPVADKVSFILAFALAQNVLYCAMLVIWIVPVLPAPEVKALVLETDKAALPNALLEVTPPIKVPATLSLV